MAESAQSIDIDPTSALHPVSKCFDRELFRKTFGVQTGDELPPEPQPAVEYTVPADGFVLLLATCAQKKNENGLHILGYSDDAQDNLFALGAASVQVNPERGINVFENTTTIPVVAGGKFLFLGGEFQRTVYTSYRPYPK